MIAKTQFNINSENTQIPTQDMKDTSDKSTPPPPPTQAIIINPEQLYGNTDDEIDLRELWGGIWAGKWIVASTTTLFAI
ncbi:MAG: hypothetical protein JKX83_01810, partial [Pseudomonadales bacterium]|nr:hypothetical protein [Pseudomonadales bacterium]